MEKAVLGHLLIIINKCLLANQNFLLFNIFVMLICCMLLQFTFNVAMCEKTKAKKMSQVMFGFGVFEKIKHSCNTIIPFFQKHKLQTQKKKEFEVFAELCLLQQQKHHLTPEGFQYCLSLARKLQNMRLIQIKIIFFDPTGLHPLVWFFFYITLNKKMT
eukprot:GHRR01000735.1.p1 GENE.GHRR01000735.1~~GHRR01000735.1.p1  ORF type:complete len:159 (+),score=1.04 GHRR01000735.1:324-800(+)